MQYVLSVLRQFTDVQPDFMLFIDASSANSTLWGCNAVASMFFDVVLTSHGFKKNSALQLAWQRRHMYEGQADRVLLVRETWNSRGSRTPTGRAIYPLPRDVERINGENSHVLTLKWCFWSLLPPQGNRGGGSVPPPARKGKAAEVGWGAVSSGVCPGPR